MVTSSFTYPASAYRAESADYSRFWFCWLPLLTIPALWFLSYAFPEWSVKWLMSESTGLIEFVNALFPLLTALIALRLLMMKQIRSDPLLLFWCVAMVAGGIYLSGEEASWGQHYVGWTTPEFWQGVNDQQETNLHNVSHWFDQKPRLVLVTGIYVTALAEPWLHLNRPNFLPRRFDFVYPALALVPIALCVLITQLLSMLPYPIHGYIYKTMRPGEFQEFYIVWFLLAYAVTLYYRARALAHPAPLDGG